MSAQDRLSKARHEVRSFAKQARPIRVGNVTYHGANLDLVPELEVEDAAFDVKTISNAFVSRKETITGSHPVKSLGAVYDSEGFLLPEFSERSRTLYDRYLDPQRIEAKRVQQAEIVWEPLLYLGQFSVHFGHFLVEALARAWAVLQTHPNIKVLFHSANVVPNIPNFALQLLASLDVDPQRIIFAHHDLRVQKLIIPRCQHWIFWKISLGFTEVFDQIVKNIQLPRRLSAPDRIYFTRRKLFDRSRHPAMPASANLGRSFANEEEIEGIFGRHGFAIIAPEQLSISEQIHLTSRATHVAGTTGSAMHLAMFNGSPNTTVISVDSRLQSTQALLESSRNHNAHHIMAHNGLDKNGSLVADTQFVADTLPSVVE